MALGGSARRNLSRLPPRPRAHRTASTPSWHGPNPRRAATGMCWALWARPSVGTSLPGPCSPLSPPAPFHEPLSPAPQLVVELPWFHPALGGIALGFRS